MKVYKVELMILDYDNLGEKNIIEVIENTHYPNNCITPIVHGVGSREIEWDDDHPLNNAETHEKTFRDLFSK